MTSPSPPPVIYNLWVFALMNALGANTYHCSGISPSDFPHLSYLMLAVQSLLVKQFSLLLAWKKLFPSGEENLQQRSVASGCLHITFWTALLSCGFNRVAICKYVSFNLSVTLTSWSSRVFFVVSLLRRYWSLDASKSSELLLFLVLIFVACLFSYVSRHAECGLMVMDCQTSSLVLGG